MPTIKVKKVPFSICYFFVSIRNCWHGAIAKPFVTAGRCAMKNGRIIPLYFSFLLACPVLIGIKVGNKSNSANSNAQYVPLYLSDQDDFY